MRNSTISVCEKPCNFFSVLLNAAVLTLKGVHNQFIFTEADIQMFEMKITVWCKGNQNMCHFSIVSHRLIYENIIIWITNFSKRCGWQQKVINPFSLFRKPIEMITLSDNSRTSHIDKIKILSIDQKILSTVESHRWKDPLTISCFICQQLKQLNNFLIN